MNVSHNLRILCFIALMAVSNYAVSAGSTYNFTLDSANGKVSLSDFSGKVSILYFGYTSCPDVCPTSLSRISMAYKSLDEAMQKKIQPIFISLDPERDKQEKLVEYLNYFLPGFVGLTGTAEDIASVAKKYNISYRKTEVENGMGYVVDHSSIYFIIDRDGELYSHLLHDVTADEIGEALKESLRATQTPSTTGIKVSEQQLRATIPGLEITSAYMRLENTSKLDKVLVGVRCDIATKVEMHEHRLSGGMMKMRQVHQLQVPANESVKFQPGGYHLMLLGLKQSLVPGDKALVTFSYQDGSTQSVEFVAQKLQ